MLDEYTVGLIVVNDLSENGWIIVTWNPPGSQGTFTIPSSEKAKGFRGQTGSVSLDIIAVHPLYKEWMLGEVKGIWNRILQDEDPQKIDALVADSFRMEILEVLVEKHVSYRVENIQEVLGTPPRKLLTASGIPSFELPEFDLVGVEASMEGERFDPSVVNLPLDISGLAELFYQSPSSLRQLP